MCADPRIKVHEIPEALLEGRSEVMICLAQTPPPSKREIAEGTASPGLMPFLQSLLLGDPVSGNNSRLDDMAPHRNRLAIVLIPEFAISMGNWSLLDATIRGLQRPLIVIGGIGIVSSDSLKSWKEEQSDLEGTTQRILGFDEDAVSGTGSIRYNAGCCWVHRPRYGTQCIVFLKNYLERATEAIAIEGLQEGEHLLCIRANDLHIYPLICAEFTSQQIALRPLDRVQTHIKTVAESESNKKFLIAGVTYEGKPYHGLWQQGIKASVDFAPFGTAYSRSYLFSIRRKTGCQYR